MRGDERCDSMAIPLLQTKFHVPRRRRGVVERPRLRERLDVVTESTLTLVSRRRVSASRR